MPPENKPLEMSVLKRVKELLAEVDARTAAKHITMVDCTVRRKCTQQLTSKLKLVPCTLICTLRCVLLSKMCARK